MRIEPSAGLAPGIPSPRVEPRLTGALGTPQVVDVAELSPEARLSLLALSAARQALADRAAALDVRASGGDLPSTEALADHIAAALTRGELL